MALHFLPSFSFLSSSGFSISKQKQMYNTTDVRPRHWLLISPLTLFGYERVRSDTLKQRHVRAPHQPDGWGLQSSSLLAKPSLTSPPSSLKVQRVLQEAQVGGLCRRLPLNHTVLFHRLPFPFFLLIIQNNLQLRLMIKITSSFNMLQVGVTDELRDLIFWTQNN